MRLHQLIFWMAALTCGSFAAEIKSPNGAIRFVVDKTDSGIVYSIKRDGVPIIESSRLVVTVDGADLTAKATLGKPTKTHGNETYPWRGAHARATNHWNGLTIPCQSFNLEVRAFDDGIAFRHRIPASGAGARTPDEDTQFTLPEGSVIWGHGLGGHYEDVHKKASASDAPAGEWIAPPMTIQLPGGGGYACIMEANLANYSGMALRCDGDRKFAVGLGHKHPISYPFRLRYSNDVDRVVIPAKVAGEIISPWRVVMISRDLNGLVNSDLVANLCDAPDPKLFPDGLETKWIKPGRAVWKYLDGGANTFDEMKRFSAWAGELGFEYNVLEGFWSRWTDEQLKELAAYSRERGVGIWLWRHSKELRTPEAREDFFAQLERVGALGAKIDFFDHEHKELIDLYQALLESAARHHIMVNFHGANKPTGEARTFPNELTREAVKGMEASKLKERAQHDATLPFTRLLAGPADYTPVHFGARKVDTSAAHQIATAVIFSGPLLTYGAHPTNLLSSPALPLIKSIPATWDETRVLAPSAIGEVAVFARRKEGKWFLAILNGPQERAIRIPLSFLPKGSHALTEFRDDSEKVISGERKSSDQLKLTIPAGGGYVARYD
jgi:alpha-glucosidase